MNDAIARELATYERRLEDMGFHPRSVSAYAKKLREFLLANPHILDGDEADSAAAIGALIGGADVAYDDLVRNASLRKWHWMRFGSHVGRKRLNAADYGPR